MAQFKCVTYTFDPDTFHLTPVEAEREAEELTWRNRIADKMQCDVSRIIRPTTQPASVPEAPFIPLWTYEPEPQRTAIPTTAQRILDLGRTQPTPAPRVVDQRAEGIGRAVANLTRRDDAFMPCANEFHP
jgi:hypothetical protein